MKACKEAVLLYPTEDVGGFDENVGDIRMRRFGFDLAKDMKNSGRVLLEKLFDNHHYQSK
ncbi:hypothetical protein HNR44_003028 [Geomicrobium halophilum]|uniref:Uncharacterized protein n=1 Tax=Geomicrobium halophilum TaxID=549000 RepID=A0A841PTD4_9BACL|nr:hypothetical protein [Geomicrobium halophilum]MBB6451034.1 hypothetical protein [Geomicrobium halophilum]